MKRVSTRPRADQWLFVTDAVKGGVGYWLGAEALCGGLLRPGRC